MLSELPFFLGLGFCLGLIWPQIIDLDVQLRWPPISSVNILQIIGVPLFALFLWRLWKVTGFEPGSVGLCATAMLVGGAGGYWFASGDAAADRRDKIIAVGAAGLFLAVAAYEYDTNFLRNVTKLSAGSVDLELSAPSALGENSPTVGGTTDTQTDPYPGRERLQIALSFLLSLPETVVRDEQYAELFSGYDRELADLAQTQSAAPNLPVLEPATMSFLSFYCNKVIPVVSDLSRLHQFHKGEVSSISLRPRLIHELRLAYERGIMRVQGDSGAALANSIDDTREWLKTEVEIDSFDETGAAAKADPPEWKKPCDLVQKVEPRLPELVDDPAYTEQDASTYIAYLAITEALAEFAFDNRERAIQLLDDDVVNFSPDKRQHLKKAAKLADESAAQSALNCLKYDKGKPEKCLAAANSLTLARSYVVRARLEEIIDTVIEISDNRALTAIRVSLTERAMKDEEGAAKLLEQSKNFDESAFFGAKLDANSSGCSLKSPESYAARGLVARWEAAVTTFRANALQSAADRPDVVVAKPFLVPILDRYAGIVASFDVECADELMSRDAASKDGLQPNLRSELLAAVASYWEAKGNRFGADPSDEARRSDLGSDQPREIFAYCQARKAFQFAKENYKRDSPGMGGTTSDEDLMTLDDRGRIFSKPSIETRMQSGYSRTNTALNRYSAGDVEKYCR